GGGEIGGGGCGGELPSRVGESCPKGAFAVASKRCEAGRARSAASEVAPMLVANTIPFCSALASGMGGSGPIKEPLDPIAPAMRCLARGETIWQLTEADQADSPEIVTRSGLET